MDQKKLLLDQVLKAYTFNGLSDHGTIIGREEALNSKGTILKLRDQLISAYPKANTSKLRQGKDLTDKDLVTVLFTKSKQIKQKNIKNIIFLNKKKTFKLLSDFT